MENGKGKGGGGGFADTTVVSLVLIIFCDGIYNSMGMFY